MLSRFFLIVFLLGMFFALPGAPICIGAAASTQNAPTSPDAKGAAVAPVHAPAQASADTAAVGNSSANRLGWLLQAPDQAPGQAPAGVPADAPAGAPVEAPAGAAAAAPATAAESAPASPEGKAATPDPAQTSAQAPGQAPGQAPAGVPADAPAGAPADAAAAAPATAAESAPAALEGKAATPDPAQTSAQAPGQAPGQAPAGVPADAAAPATAAESAPAVSGKKKPVSIDAKSILPLRVLTRSMSSLYKGPSEESGVLQGNLPAFLPYYVYTRPGGEERSAETGWYEVGTDNRGNIAGWLKAGDVFEWKQTMCLTYTHPENRKPVLMFAGKEDLAGLIAKEGAARASDVSMLYTTIDSGNIPKDFSVVSVEPKMAVDFTKQFYLLPILDHQSVSLDGREARMLELAAVSGAGAQAREKTDIRHNPEYAKSAGVSADQAASSVQQNLKFDIVWVVDTTRSMGPFISATRDVVRDVSAKLAKDEAIAKQLRFGVWGYRDPVEAIPGIEYTTKNFTADLLPIDAFVPVIGTVEETKVDSIDFPEDVFSGLSDAVAKTNWTPSAVRFLVLVGDAPSHELGHKFNISGYDEGTLRSLATENNVTILAVQIRPKGAVTHQKKAEAQFKVLATGPGAMDPSYFSVQGAEMAAFTLATERIVTTLTGVIKAAQSAKLDVLVAAGSGETGGELAALAGMGEQEPAKPVSAEATTALQEGTKGLNQAVRAAVVQWIGSSTGAQAPRDIVAWVVDKDLTDTTKQALDVRLFINKRQLDSLATLLKDMIAAGRKGQISGNDFFSSLQAASAVASRDPDMLKNAKSLAESGLVPDFLTGLPYNSRIMAMTNDLWNSWSPDEQDNFLNELDAKTKAYRALHDNPQGWIALNEGADTDEKVYPIPLELLP